MTKLTSGSECELMTFDNPGRHPDSRDIGRNIVNYECSGSDHAPCSNGDLLFDNRTGSDINTFADVHIAADGGRGVDIGKIADDAVVGYGSFHVQDGMFSDRHVNRPQEPRSQAGSFANLDIDTQMGARMNEGPRARGAAGESLDALHQTPPGGIVTNRREVAAITLC